MISLILSLLVVTLIWWVSGESPYMAGLLAVVPIKILIAGYMATTQGGRDGLLQAVEGMLIGQFLWGFALLALFWWLRTP